jgi:hypothetical protein
MRILYTFPMTEAQKSVIRDIQRLAELCFISLLFNYILLGRRSSYTILIPKVLYSISLWRPLGDDEKLCLHFSEEFTGIRLKYYKWSSISPYFITMTKGMWQWSLYIIVFSRYWRKIIETTRENGLLFQLLIENLLMSSEYFVAGIGL